MEKLTPEQIEAKIGELPQWSLNGESLQRTFNFDDFVGAIAFVNRVAELAESIQHHPDIMIRFSKVTLTLTTHDANGLTEGDFSFAHTSDSFVPAPEPA